MARLSFSDILQIGEYSRRALPPLDVTGSPSQVVERVGDAKTNAGRKKAQLLHLVGMEVQDTYEYLQDPGPVNAETDDAFPLCLRKLNAHFRADDNVPYECHVFRQLALMRGETADKFVVCLRKQGHHCNSGQSLNENLRDQLIETTVIW